MSVLFGIHDREGANIVPAGGWVVDTVALSENPQPTDYTALRGDVNWIVRLNWGYGSTGTVPLPHEYGRMAAACAEYVAKSRGCDRWIIGNEPNHEQERPNGVYITPAYYADCYLECRDAIKAVRPAAQVIPAPIAPYHATPMPWLAYWREMLQLIADNGGCDGIALHAYTRSADPADIQSEAKMAAPLAGLYYGFRTYRDQLDGVPAPLRSLPAYLTEFTELLPDGWHDRNTGVVQAAYEEIHRWNTRGDTQKIHCLCLYRWPRYDQWHIEGKQGVIDDFKAATQRNYASPQTTHMPAVHGPTPAPVTTPAIEREIDPRLIDRGVTIETPALAPGQQYWRVAKARWFSGAEAGGRHHIYVEAPNGTPFRVEWPSGSAPGYANGRDGFDAGNFAMSKSLNEFSVRIDDGTPSEAVKGIGMGANGNSGIHTSTLVTFELATVPTVAQPAPQPVTVPPLAHPVQDPQFRVVTQRFGERPDYYRRFAVDGVSLRGHNGVDFGTPPGTAIAAVDVGRVVEVADDPTGYGLYVKVAHAWGESLYAHLSAQLCDVHESVERGETVGLSGFSGNVQPPGRAGAHLHFGLRVHPFNRQDGWGGFVDPLPYLSNKASQPVTDKKEIVKAIGLAALEFDVDPDLLLSQAWAESSFDPKAISRVGAKGLFQIMPPTWDEWAPKVGASNPFDAVDSARVGAAYMQWLLQQTQGNAWRALVAYGWGIGNVIMGEVPPATWTYYANKIIHGRDLLKAVG